MSVFGFVAFLLLVAVASASAETFPQDLVEVAFSPASSSVYLGSPSIVQTTNAIYVSHDTFFNGGTTYVLESRDSGRTWEQISEIRNQYWSSIFEHRDSLYLLGTSSDTRGANVAISRSDDFGRTWSQSTLLAPPEGCSFATGSVPVVQGSVIVRSMELWCGPALRWPQSYKALVVAAPANSDLMDPDSWAVSSPVPFNTSFIPSWFPEPVVSGGYLEGNVVLDRNDKLWLLMRSRFYNRAHQSYTLQHAGLFAVSQANQSVLAATLLDAAVECRATSLRAASASRTRSATSKPNAELSLEWNGIISMPGGGNKFAAKYDTSSGYYLALTNPSVDRYGPNADARNILVLAYSNNLIDWRVATTILVPDDGLDWDQSLWRTSYMYPDFVYASNDKDLLIALRSSFNGASNFHNSNHIFFRRLEDYRQYLPPQWRK